MSKIQIEKDFRELIPGGNVENQIQQYYKLKKKEMCMLLLFALFLLGVSLYSEYQFSRPEGNILERNEYGEGKKEVDLEIKVNEENWDSFVMILDEKEYTEQEINQLYQMAAKELPNIIIKDNSDLNKITSNLELVTALDEYPFRINWNSSRPEIIDEDGEVYFENVTQEVEVSLKASFQYEEWEREEVILVKVLPKSKDDYLFYLSKSLKEKEGVTRKEKDFLLPDTYQENSLQWRYPTSNSTIVLGILFLIILPFVSYQKDAEIHRKIQKRREELMDSFPDFIFQLVLYLEAGMSVSGALFRFLQDGQRKNKKKYLYEELAFVCRQIKNGLPEKEGYELLAVRCNLPCYRKLTNLLIQHIQKGSNTILDTLRKEAIKAIEEKKGRIQKRGEEMGTKLLLPMMIMLLIVMVFIMVPALFSFQV